MAGPWPPSGAGVSARESEVLAALGEHLTNAEIGARLFISIRTVESHVSSLLRKLGVSDRRALTAAVNQASPVPAPRAAASGSLPSPLTPFVGRVAERSALTATLGEHRLVTAVGPGGVGKTRLALRVAADSADRFADGVWYVDLVPVTDPLMTAPAVAAALGVSQSQRGSAADTVTSWLSGRRTLLVLDNCEHLVDGVVVLLERLLAAAPGLVVLATSRARLLVPHERVFPVPGMSVDVDGAGSGDAVELFLERAVAAGPLPAVDRRRIAAVCRGLDGMALAVELAAARFPSLGLDGLEAGLADRLQVLSGGARIDDRHRSLRATLDWSYALLDDASQTVLRRVSVFAEPFAADAAAAVLADRAPVTGERVPDVLAGLCDQSLLVALGAATGMRYQALETIRQYGAERLQESGESDDAHARHTRWCLSQCATLEAGSRVVDAAWRASFDRVADELRAALAWVSGEQRQRADAFRLATSLAELSFLRGLPRESQHRFEQAAIFAADDAQAALALANAAGAAEARHVGDDALRLWLRAADASVRAGDGGEAARCLARHAELIGRGPGLLATRPREGDAQASIERGRTLAGDDAAAWARLFSAAAVQGPPNDPETMRLVDRAISLAREAGDPFAESAALDHLTAVQLAHGEIGAAAASALRRTELLAPMPVRAYAGLEFGDAYIMATECAVAAGDLVAARAFAEGLRDLPFYREEAHLGGGRLLLVTVLSGDWSTAAVLAERFREGWERAGRPRAGNLVRGAYAAATLFGLLGLDSVRAEWLDVVAGLETPGRPVSDEHVDEVFDAMLLLHRGQPRRALARMTAPPEQLDEWYSGLWRPWYAALRAEAAVLTDGHPADDGRFGPARDASVDNPIASALVDRAEILADGAPILGELRAGGRRDLAAVAAALDAAGCRYQAARTLVMIDAEHRARGERMLAEMGATPMVWPPGPG